MKNQTKSNKKRLPANTSRHKKRKMQVILYILLGISSIGFVFSSLLAVNIYNNSQKQLETRAAELEQLFLSSQAVLGAACTALPLETAQTLLNTSVVRSNSNLMLPIEKNDEIVWWHADSCRYVSREDDSRYAELFITTYAREDIAAAEFNKRLPVVEDAVELRAEDFAAEKALYDAGVHYLLKGQQIIEVAASNGSPSTQEQFSRQLLLDVLTRIQPVGN